MTDEIIVSKSELETLRLNLLQAMDMVGAQADVVKKILDHSQVVNSEPVARIVHIKDTGLLKDKTITKLMLDNKYLDLPSGAELYATPQPAPAPDIDTLVNRFLVWKLPDDFAPDNGITFDSEYNKEYMASIGKPPLKREPVGTNLFNASQAKAMLQYVLAGYQNELAMPPDTVPRAEYDKLLDVLKLAEAKIKALPRFNFLLNANGNGVSKWENKSGDWIERFEVINIMEQAIAEAEAEAESSNRKVKNDRQNNSK